MGDGERGGMKDASNSKLARRRARADWRPPEPTSSPGLWIDIDRETCTGCRLCILACPTNCFDFDADVSLAYVTRLDACIVCRVCEEVCRPDSIKVLLTRRHGELSGKGRGIDTGKEGVLP